MEILCYALSAAVLVLTQGVEKAASAYNGK